MKIDFNLEMGDSNDDMAGYYHSWYTLLDQLHDRFTRTFFEGCASGGMRLDLNTLAYFDGHFLSDTVNPLDILRITQGALLRVPPGRLTRWAVMRQMGKFATVHDLSPDIALERVIAPRCHGWADPIIADVVFICRVALPGMYGYSGDLARLTPKIRQRLRHHSEFYLRWRAMLASSICHLLTPISNLRCRSGWVAFQLQNPAHKGTNLIFAYRMEDGLSKRTFPLYGLDPRQNYTVVNEDSPDIPTIHTGQELLCTGLVADLPSKFSAGIYIVEPEQGKTAK